MTRRGVTLESLADSGARRFQSLDLKLSAAAAVVIKESHCQILIDAVHEKDQQFMHPDSDTGATMLKGRQLIWMIYNHF